jgi:hypothetical protein
VFRFSYYLFIASISGKCETNNLNDIVVKAPPTIERERRNKNRKKQETK